MSAPAPVSVHEWGEMVGEQRHPGVLRVLIGGVAAGAVTRDGPVWSAQSYTGRGYAQPRFSEHATAAEAVRAVARSGWSRKLGARAASDLHWPDRARRVVDRASRTGGAR